MVNLSNLIFVHVNCTFLNSSNVPYKTWDYFITISLSLILVPPTCFAESVINIGPLFEIEKTVIMYINQTVLGLS